MGFISTIEPKLLDPKRWWTSTPITDVTGLKPEPDRYVLLIVGDSAGVLDDLKEFVRICPVPFDTMAINYSPKIIPWPIQHFIAGDSHHDDMQAVARSLPDSVLKHCWNKNVKEFQVWWRRNGYDGWDGTTANLGLLIGVCLGYLKIVFAGCPMDESGNWYNKILKPNDRKQGKVHSAHLWKWTQLAGRPVSRLARSMSGNTADLLGKPTTEWLEEL